MELTDGSIVVGVPAVNGFPVKTSYATMSIPLKAIESIAFSEDKETSTLSLASGDRLTGVLDLNAVKLRTLFGAAIIDLQHVASLEVRSAGSLGARMLRGLVLHFSFDGDDGAAAVDKSEKRNNGTIHGAKRTTRGKAGSAYEFDGIDDRIEVPYDASLFPGKAFTLCAWIYRRELSRLDNIISATYNNPPNKQDAPDAGKCARFASLDKAHRGAGDPERSRRCGDVRGKKGLITF